MMKEAEPKNKDEKININKSDAYVMEDICNRI